MTDKFLTAALAYAAKGWPVFPVRANKKPLTTYGVGDATTNPAQIRKLWAQHPKANIAMDVGGAGMMVLDLDPGHDIKELERNVGKIPKTNLSASTPRGGRHLFLEIGRGDIVAPSSSKLAPHVDVRSFHSYVLLAPSRTIDGVYAWEKEGKPAFRTDEIFRVCNVGREKHEDRDNWIIGSDLEENVLSAIKWLETEARIAVEGQGGDNLTYATAAMMKSFGISEALAVELMEDHWNLRCNPPWDSDDLAVKVRNGYQYNTSPPGNCTPSYHNAVKAAMFEPVNTQKKENTDSEHEWTEGRFRFVDRQGLALVRPPEWLVYNLLPRGGYGLLIGARSSLKTYLALDIALTIACGGGLPRYEGGPNIKEWKGIWKAVRQGAVLFAAGEGRPGIKQRVEAWESYHLGGQKVQDFVLADPVPRITEKLDPFIAGALRKRDSYLLSIMDTVGRAMQGANENAQEHASAFTMLVEAMQRRLGSEMEACTILALHHSGHDHSGRARGSSVFEADADTIITTERDDLALEVTLDMTKQKDAPEWQKPKLVRALIVKTGIDSDALVMAPPEKGAKAPKRQKRGKNKKKRGVSYDLTDINDIAVAVLKSNKIKELSDTSLSIQMACYKRSGETGQALDISDRQIRAYLPELRNMKNDLSAAHMYSAANKRWRWSKGD